MSDLGGASFLPLQDKALMQCLTKLDLRAYQVLVEELASIAGLTEEETKVLKNI